MKTRMQPIGNAWSKLPRIVRDLANELGKKINIDMHGEDTELDRQVLELIQDPFTHMVRNSADHGLETVWAYRLFQVFVRRSGSMGSLDFDGGKAPRVILCRRRVASVSVRRRDRVRDRASAGVPRGRA